MLQKKQVQISKMELSKLIQSAKFKNIILVEPYNASDEKALTDILKRHKSDNISIIIGVTR